MNIFIFYYTAKSKLIFIEPDNVIGIERMPYYDDGLEKIHLLFAIKLKYPYDDHTGYKSHYDEESGREVIDYYYYYPMAYGKDYEMILR